MNEEEPPDPGLAVLILAVLTVGCWLLLALGIQAWLKILGG